MTSLLLVAHGSRRAASNDEIRQLTRRLREQARDRFQGVDCAFLELAEPSIPAAIDTLVGNGAQRVVVLPYFLSRGRHVAEDVPGVVAERSRAYPGVEITVAPYLGSAAGLEGLLLSLVD